jgi:hypothetical protein
MYRLFNYGASVSVCNGICPTRASFQNRVHSSCLHALTCARVCASCARVCASCVWRPYTIAPLAFLLTIAPLAFLLTIAPLAFLLTIAPLAFSLQCLRRRSRHGRIR